MCQDDSGGVHALSVRAVRDTTCGLHTGVGCLMLIQEVTAQRRTIRLFFRVATVVLLFVLPGILPAQTPAGAWLTLDDDTGEPTSVIVIEEDDGILTGRIDSLINPEEPDPVCDQCDGEKHNQPILGMEILWDMEQDGDEWSGGRILDPRNGKTYRCKLWLEGDRLFVRGYVGFFRRTEIWLPLAPGN